jgi:hypothetical protein
MSSTPVPPARNTTFSLSAAASILGGSVIKATDGSELALAGTLLNSGTVLVSGTTSATVLELDSVTVSGGKLETSGASALIETVAGSNVLHGVTIVSGSLIEVASGTQLTLSGGTIGSGATVAETSGGTLAVSGLATASGTLSLSGTTSVAAHALLETLSGGTALLSGAVINSGTLFAGGAHSLIEIASGATVTGGGIAEIGNGVIRITAPLMRLVLPPTVSITAPVPIV